MLSHNFTVINHSCITVIVQTSLASFLMHPAIFLPTGCCVFYSCVDETITRQPYNFTNVNNRTCVFTPVGKNVRLLSELPGCCSLSDIRSDLCKVTNIQLLYLTLISRFWKFAVSSQSLFFNVQCHPGSDLSVQASNLPHEKLNMC